MNFQLVGCINVTPIVEALAATAWDWEDWRKNLHFSPHRNSDVITLRGPASNSPRAVLHSLDVVDCPPMNLHCVACAVRDAGAVIGRDAARAMIVRLPASGEVQPHIDVGQYADATDRFHVALSTNDKARLLVEDEERHFKPGQVWFLDKHKRHAAANEGETARVHLIVDVWRA